MNVLLIHQAFTAGDEAGGTRHFEFGQRMAAAGDRLTVVAGQVSYLTGKRLHPERRAFFVREHKAGVEILRAYSPALTHRSFGWRVAGFLIFAVTSVMAAFRAGRPDVVMGTSPPMFQALSALLVARLRRAPFLLEIRDLWPEFAIEMGVLRNPIMQSVARRLERFLYRHADHILVNSPAFRSYLERAGVPPAQITCIPNGVDNAMFHPETRGASIRLRFGLADKIVVVYAGALGMANDLHTLISAAEQVQCDHQIHFLIVGDGKERPNLETECENRRLKNVAFADHLPKASMPEVLAAADICVATLMNIPLFTTTYPNKVFDYMSAGRPTVLAIDGVIRDVIERAGGGIFVSPGDPHALAAAIQALAHNPDLRAQMGRSARNYVEQHFERDQQAEAFRQLIRTMTTKRRDRAECEGALADRSQ